MTTVAPSMAPSAIAPIAQRLPDIIYQLQQSYPTARLSLNYSNSLELLIATILVGKSSEEEVNAVTEVLFSRFQSAEDYIEAPRMEIERILRPLALLSPKSEAHSADVPSAGSAA